MKTFLIFFSIFLVSCKGRISKQSLNDFMQDPKNNLTQQIKIGQTNIISKWLPSDYMNLSNDRQSSLNSVTSDSGTYSFFNVKFENTTGDKLSKEKLLYVNFDMQKDFSLIIGSDSISPVICQKIENGKPGSYEYLLAFEHGKSDAGDVILSYSDNIFSIGNLAFLYKQEDLQRISNRKRTATL